MDSPVLPRQALLYLLALAAVLWGLHQSRRVFWAFALLSLPGTLAHEACHFLMGLLLRGEPAGFTLVPRRQGTGWAMGSVTFSRIKWYNAFFIGLAPLLLLPAAYGLVLWRLKGHPALGWPEALAVYFIANLVYAAVPSWQDLKIAVRSPIGWILLAAALAWGWSVLARGRALPPPGARAAAFQEPKPFPRQDSHGRPCPSGVPPCASSRLPGAVPCGFRPSSSCPSPRPRDPSASGAAKAG